MTFLTSRAPTLHGQTLPVGSPISVGDGPDAGDGLARALAGLRRGEPCVVVSGTARLGVVSAETVGATVLSGLRGAADATGPLLLLAGGRAAALLTLPSDAGDVVALRLPDAGLEPATLLGFADPTAEQPPSAGGLVLAETPPAADACIALAKLARLLPAVLVVVLPPGRDLADAVAVDAAHVLAAGGRRAETLVRVAEAAVPLADAAEARVVAFRAAADGMEHLAILVGRPEAVEAPLVRIHSECFTGDLLGSLRCDCGPQLRGAIRRMAGEGAGAVLYLAQEGRGIGLVNKLRAYALQDRGMDTIEANEALGWGADERDFGIAGAMLRALGLGRVRLLTNNPRKLAALAQAGIAVERVSHLFASNGVNDAYLATKVARFGHLAD